MFQIVDRVVLAVPHVNNAIEYCEDLFGCLVVDEIFDREGCARRVVLQFGESLLELLEPRGPGPVLDFIEQGRAGAFAAGLAVSDPTRFANSLSDKGIVVYTQSPRRFVVFPDECGGCGIIITKLRSRSPIGLVKGIKQITFHVADLAGAVTFFSRLFDIDPGQFEFSPSGIPGVDAHRRAIAWLESPSAACGSSIEWIASGSTPNDASRFAGVHSAVLCKVTAESDQLQEIRKRAVRIGYKWREPPSNGLLPMSVLDNLLIQVVGAEIADEPKLMAKRSGSVAD